MTDTTLTAEALDRKILTEQLAAYGLCYFWQDEVKTRDDRIVAAALAAMARIRTKSPAPHQALVSSLRGWANELVVGGTSSDAATVRLMREAAAALSQPVPAPQTAEKMRADLIEQCAYIAIHGCLVPPDGGSPTESERLMCEDIAARIRTLHNSPPPNPNGEGE